MPERVKNADYLDIGGMNSSEPTTRLRKGQCPLLQNVEFADKRVWSRRNDYHSIGNTISGTPTIVELVNFIKANGDDYLVALAGNKLYSLTSLTGTWTDEGTLTASGSFDFETLNNLLIIAREGGDLAKFDGTDLEALGGGPPSTIISICNFRNRLFAQVANSSRVYFSGLGLPESWDLVNDYIDVNVDDGDRNNGLVVWGDRLIMFKRHNTYQLTGYSKDTYECSLFLAGIGCFNHRSIKPVGGGVIWQAEKKIFRLSSSGLDEISYPIRATMDTINTAFIGNAAYYPQKNQYLLAVDTDANSRTDKILVFDTLEEKWSVWTGTTRPVDFSALGTTTIGSTGQVKTVVVGRYDTGLAFELDFPGNGEAFEVDSAEFDCGMPFTEKDFRYVFLWMEVDNIAKKPYVDYLIDGTTIETNLRPAATVANKMYPVRLNIGRKGKYIQFKVKFTEATGGFHLGGFSIGYVPREEWP